MGIFRLFAFASGSCAAISAGASLAAVSRAGTAATALHLMLGSVFADSFLLLSLDYTWLVVIIDSCCELLFFWQCFVGVTKLVAAFVFATLTVLVIYHDAL